MPRLEWRWGLRAELSETTVITVAQRVSSVMSSDLILVLEDGEVIGMGTHEQLLEGRWCSYLLSSWLEGFPLQEENTSLMVKLGS